MSTAERWIDEAPTDVFGHTDDEQVPTNAIELDGWFDYQLQRLADIKSEMEHNRAVYDAWVAKRREWLDEQNAVLARAAEAIERRIHEHAAGYDYGRKKSRKLPSGEFGTRQKPLAVEVQDKTAALSWCEREFPAGVREKVTRELDLKELKGLASNGVVPEGCTVIPEHDEFYVRVSK